MRKQSQTTAVGNGKNTGNWRQDELPILILIVMVNHF